ncbi:hypothetical protein BDD12DRAFT_270085 [Trichophaea hybrida]|nr:hypothetical protein BDD12DRAFT_270085 [Trichophaea hybrida]
MQAPMQPSSSSPRGLQVPCSFGARRSISHDLARFSLDLAPERRRAHNNVPYPSPPMSHSPPPPLNPPSPNDPRHQTSAFYSSQPVQFGVNISLSGDPETYPAPFPPINSSNDRYPPPVISPIGDQSLMLLLHVSIARRPIWPAIPADLALDVSD